MRPFEVDGQRYIRINGKSFYLLRGYCIRYEKFVFVQVFGRGALTKDDLPEKNWELLATKGREGKVYTAWKPGFFDGSNEQRLFLGATKEASVRSLLTTVAPGIDISRALAAAFRADGAEFLAGTIRHETGIAAFDDHGNSGVPAFGINHSHSLNTWIRELMEAPCPTR